MKRSVKTLLAMVLAAAVLTALAGLGALDTLDYAACDALYQSRAASDGEVVLIGIDDRAIAELGPYSQWSREIIAQVLDLLNASEDCRPAAIGIDVLYTGDSSPEADRALAEAAGACLALCMVFLVFRDFFLRIYTTDPLELEFQMVVSCHVGSHFSST